MKRCSSMLAACLSLLLVSYGCKDKLPQLSWGEGGGFTGAQHGYTAYANGTVEEWSQWPGQSRQSQKTWKLNSAQQQTLQTLYQQLQALPPYTNWANYTRFITLYLQQDTLHWAWEPSDTQATARTLQNLYDSLNQSLQQQP